jgi:hypothetical protein
MSETTTIQCDCTVCDGKRAMVRGDGRMSATKRHNMVQLAHSPLSGSASAKQFGPWAVK